MANELLTIFLDEAQEHLQALNENVLHLESSPDNVAVVGEIFRSAHTFKGMSATMGYTTMANLTHKMENVLDEIRNGRLSVTSEVIDVIFECIDSLEKMVADVQEGGSGNIPVSGTMQRLEAFMNRGHSQPKGSELSEEIETEATHIVHIAVSESAVLKAVRAIMCMEALQRIGQIAGTNPPIDKIEADEFGTRFSIHLVTDHEADEIEQAVMSISEIEKAEVESLLKQELASQSQPEQAAEQAALASKTTAKGAKVESRTIRVQLEKIEKLMNMFEESVIERGRISELAEAIANKELVEHLNRLGDISKDIQNLLLNMRMVPIETVFNRFPRMVRTLAKELGKKIDLQVVGEDTEVDKIVIDEIADPLVHLIRNAIDHGIETVEERRSAGKSETGLIKLEAFHSGNHVVIQITDDGRGINRVKVLEKAVSKGIVTEAESAKLSDREIHELIFSSGFSTAEVVSDLSGRGVGMDVVKHTINALGGHLMIESEEGKGSTFRIELPLTLSIIQSMLVHTEERRYALPLGNIVEAIRVDQGEIQVIQGKSVLNYRDQIIEVIQLGDIFNEKRAEEQERMIPVLIVRNTRRSYGLVVSGIIGQREIVLKSLGDFFANSSKYFSGATILGDGRVVLIVNPEGF